MDLSVLCKIFISLSFRHHSSIPYSIAGLTQLLETANFNLKGNFPYSNTMHSLNLTYPHLVLAVTAASHPPPAPTLSPRYVNSFYVFTSLHNFSSRFTASPIFPLNFLHVKLHKKTLESPFSLWNMYLRSTYHTVLTKLS